CVQTLGATAQRCALGLTVPAAAPALQRALESVDERVRTIATEGCATSEETPSLARLAPLANDPSASVRTAAAQAFGRLGAAGLPALQQLVHDRDDGVRAAAADELGKNLPVDALAQLVLGTLEDDVVRPELIASLRRLPGNVALPLLEAEMKHGNATERRLVAAQFARFNDPSVYDVLFQIASRDPDDDTRHIAAKILGN
ncbi:MAG TPA: HEAT repeat domain-containing protein, partial [Myxococcales bacterium]|nr:HEAT repeat domain-containing protein [Myxococcales bacterium]